MLKLSARRSESKSRLPTWPRLFLFLATLFVIHSYCYHAAKMPRSIMDQGLSTLDHGLHTDDAHLWKRATGLQGDFEPAGGHKHKDKNVQSPSWIPYLETYNKIKTQGGRIGFTIGLILWLLFLFSCVGIVASDFFCPNLQVISSKMGLSESVAGSTILAFGNGSPDVFSTFASLSAGSGSLAIGELLGAAAFIVSVVAGVMTLVRPFKVARHSFMRDVGFFTVAVFFMLTILWDKHITQVEAGAMVILYVGYVVAVVLSSWWHNRKERKEELLQKARSNYADDALPSTAATTPGFTDVYSDQSESSALNRRRSSFTVYHTLSPEAPPRGNSPSQALRSRLETPIDEEILLEYAERSTPVVLTRPRGHGRTRSASSAAYRLPMARTAVRPSLLGAIEFRDVVNSLSEDSSARTLALFGGNSSNSQVGSDSNTPVLEHYSATLPRPAVDRRRSEQPLKSATGSSNPGMHGRARSLAGLETSTDDNVWTQPSVSPDRSQTRTNLIDLSSGVEDPWRGATPPDHLSPIQPRHALKIEIPHSTVGSGALTAEASPRQTLRKVPSIVLTGETGQITPIVPGSPDRKDSLASRLMLDQRKRRKIKYTARSLAAAFFPSLTEIQGKSVIGIIASIISSPALFVLILTLPVVDEEQDEMPLGLEEEKREDVLANNVLAMGDASEEDDGPGWRARARHRDEHIGHIMHSPVAIHRLSHHDYYSSPLDINSVDKSLTLIGHSQEALSEESTPMDPFLEDGGVSPPATINGADMESDVDEQVYIFQTALQCFLAPFFCLFALLGDQLHWWYPLVAVAASLGLSFLGYKIARARRARIFLCFVGFVVSMVWLLSIVNEIIGVLQAVGHVFGLSDAILGVTVFALGNSTADLVADWTIARMGYPVMAISACYGGPLLNLLLGVGASGSYFIAKSGQPYFIDFDLTLITTCIGLLVILVATLIFIPMNDYVMSRSWGICACLSLLRQVSSQGRASLTGDSV